MLPDRVSNPGPLTYESGALPIALRGPAFLSELCFQKVAREGIKVRKWEAVQNLTPVFMLVLSVW